MAETQRHKVFVSFHHEDQYYKDFFCDRMYGDIVDKSVEDGDIDLNIKTETTRQKIRDEFIADATVAVVLVGRCTWQRKHVDWEIGSSLRDTRRNSRCGLLGILLPDDADFGRSKYSSRLIPPRLADNSGFNGAFARIYDWPNPWNSTSVQSWIHLAFLRREQNPDNSRAQFAYNRSGSCSSGWSD